MTPCITICLSIKTLKQESESNCRAVQDLATQPHHDVYVTPTSERQTAIIGAVTRLKKLVMTQNLHIYV